MKIFLTGLGTDNWHPFRPTNLNNQPYAICICEDTLVNMMVIIY